MAQVAAAGLGSILAAINLEIVKRAGGRRMGHGRAEGARLPVSVAGAAVSLGVIEDLGDLKTPLGYKTARRKLVPVLEALDPRDPRRMAADALGDAVERLGASGGVDWMGGDSNGEISDGGATTKIKYAERVAMIKAAVNGWPLAVNSARKPRRPRAVMRLRRHPIVPGRDPVERQEILVFPALLAVCVEGRGLYDVLRSYGWSAQSYNAKRLAVGVLAALDDAAEALGYGRAVPKKTVDGS